jgi:hypothetical protein
VNNGIKLNIFAKDHDELRSYLRDHELNLSDVRHIDTMICLYGMWRGVLTVLPMALERHDAERIMGEAVRRGMTIDVVEGKV